MSTPLYLFTGFLESGKTKFIQETFEDPRFEDGSRTLLLVCEEGVEEYDTSRFAVKDWRIETIESKDDLTAERLLAIEKDYAPEKIIVEYNGMWMLNDLFAALPENWVVYQEFSFADAATYLTYNANMRQLTYDKLATCDVIVFNRWSDDYEMMAFHKIVRGASRRAQIFYEYPDGRTEPDDIEDPLPFDINADVIEIRDRDYAYWYRDMSEDMKKYDGKTVRLKAVAAYSGRLPKGVFAVGRQLMTCCVEDIQWTGLVCMRYGEKPEPKKWYTITARIEIAASSAYGGQKGPILHVTSLEPADPPEEEVATFF
jgi:hypothetical protein